MRVAPAGEIGAPVRGIDPRLRQRSSEPSVAQRGVRQKRRNDQADGDGCGNPDRQPVLSVAPAPACSRHGEHREPDHQQDEDAVIAAADCLCRHDRAQHRAACRRRAIGEPMKGEHAEREAGGHQQLNVCGVGEEVRTKGEAHGRNRRRPPIAGQIPGEVIHAGRRQDERQQHHRIVCGVRIAPGEPVRRNRERSRAEVAFRIRQRQPMGIEDVGVEDVERIGDERAGDPGHVPDGHQAITVVNASDSAELKRQWIRHRHGDHGADDHDEPKLSPTRAHHRSLRAGTALNLIITPRLR